MDFHSSSFLRSRVRWSETDRNELAQPFGTSNARETNVSQCCLSTYAVLSTASRENNLIVSQPVPNMVTSQKDYATVSWFHIRTVLLRSPKSETTRNGLSETDKLEGLEAAYKKIMHLPWAITFRKFNPTKESFGTASRMRDEGGKQSFVRVLIGLQYFTMERKYRISKVLPVSSTS